MRKANEDLREQLLRAAIGVRTGPANDASAQLQARVASLEVDLTMAKTELSAALEAQTTSQAAQRQLQEEVASLRKELTAANRERADAVARANRLDASSAAVIARHKQAEQEALARAASAEEAAARANADRVTAVAELELLRAQQRTETHEADGLRQQLRLLDARSEELARGLDEQRERAAVAAAAIARGAQAHSTKTVELQGALAVLEQRLREAEAERDQHRTARAALESHAAELEHQLVALDAELVAHQEALAAGTSNTRKVAQLSAELTRLEDLLTAVEASIAGDAGAARGRVSRQSWSSLPDRIEVLRKGCVLRARGDLL